MDSDECEDRVWLQIRVYFYKQEDTESVTDSEYSKMVLDSFTVKKLELLRKFVKPLRDEIYGELADKWHFLGTYFKQGKLYIDTRFRIHKEYIPNCKAVSERQFRSLSGGLVTNELEFDETFYQNYLKRYTTEQIELILEILQLCCNRYLEVISSQGDCDETITQINTEFFKLFGEVSHLVLFQAGIDDTTFHLKQAFKWSKGQEVIDLLINYLVQRKQLFREELSRFENEIQIPTLLDMIERHAQIV